MNGSRQSGLARHVGLASVLLLAVLLVLYLAYSKPDRKPSLKGRAMSSITKHSVQTILNTYRAQVEKRLKPVFVKRGVEWPPSQISMLAFKKEQRLELWAMSNNRWQLVKYYPFTATSGVLGPKLKEGDRQIPEGIYRISAMNPNSAYHLSMKINYPNKFDMLHAKKEKRNQPGSNIFIHGRAASAGCIALGDTAIEELFVLVAMVKQDDIPVIVAPWDFRTQKPELNKIRKDKRKPWLPNLYKKISEQLKDYAIVEKT